MHADHMLDLVTLRYVYPWRAQPKDQRLRVILPPGSADQVLDLARGVGSARHFEDCFRLAEHDGSTPITAGDSPSRPSRRSTTSRAGDSVPRPMAAGWPTRPTPAPCAGLNDLADAPTCS